MSRPVLSKDLAGALGERAAALEVMSLSPSWRTSGTGAYSRRTPPSALGKNRLCPCVEPIRLRIAAHLSNQSSVVLPDPRKPRVLRSQRLLRDRKGFACKAARPRRAIVQGRASSGRR